MTGASLGAGGEGDVGCVRLVANSVGGGASVGGVRGANGTRLDGVTASGGVVGLRGVGCVRVDGGARMIGVSIGGVRGDGNRGGRMGDVAPHGWACSVRLVGVVDIGGVGGLRGALWCAHD
jgi:hypothetical protein